MVVVMLGWAVEFPPAVGVVLLLEATWWEAQEQRNRILIAMDAAEPGETQIKPDWRSTREPGSAKPNRCLMSMACVSGYCWHTHRAEKKL